jgi:hypothetical protein
VRKTRWVNRGSRVETARSRSAMLFLISVSGDGGGEGFWSSSGFLSDDWSSVGFISTSGMVEYGRYRPG